MCKEDSLQAENDSLKRDLIKYGAHTVLCTFVHKGKCICGFDEVKENALEIIIEDQRRLWTIRGSRE